MRNTKLSTVGMMLIVAAIAAPARAQVAKEDELLRRGVESRRNHDDMKAWELFHQAYELHQHPRAAAQMGLAEQALGRWIDAEAHLVEALAASSDGWIDKHAATLRTSLAQVRTHVGSLEVLGGPAGAEIVIEGAVVGKLPLTKPIHVRAGECRFEMTAPGYEPVTRSVQVAAGALVRETVNLSRSVVAAHGPAAEMTAPPPPPREAARPAVEATAKSGDGPASASERERPERAGNQGAASRTESRPEAASVEDHTGGNPGARLAGIILGATGVAAIGAGVAFGMAAKSAGESASKSAVYNPNADSRGRLDQTLQWVGYGVGAALVAAGVTTYVLGRERAGDTETKVSLVPTPSGFAAALGGRF